MPELQVESGGVGYGTHDRWLVLSQLFANYFTIYVHRNLINYLQIPLQAELGLSGLQMGLLHWGFLFPYAAAQIAVGYLGDRFRRRSVLLGSLIASCVTMAAMGMARGFASLLLLRFLLAVAQSASVPATASLMADCFTARNRSRAVGIYLLSNPFSIAVAGWLGGYAADQFGWRRAMWAFGGGGVVVVCILAALLREPVRTERKKGVGLGTTGATWSRTLWAVLSVRSFAVLSVAYILVNNVGQISLYWLGPYFQRLFQLNSADAGSLATMWIQAGSVVGLFVGGAWADRWARRQFRSRTVVQVVGLLVCVPALAAMGLSHDRTVLIPSMLAFGFGMSLYLGNLWNTTFEVIDPAARATAIGLLNVAAGVLGSWSSPLVGYLHDRRIVDNLGQVFLGMSLLTGVSTVLLCWMIVAYLPHDYRGPQSDSR